MELVTPESLSPYIGPYILKEVEYISFAALIPPVYLDGIKYLEEQTSVFSQEQFLKDETVKRAFVRSIEIIGEATKKVPPELKQRYPDVEWHFSCGDG